MIHAFHWLIWGIYAIAAVQYLRLFREKKNTPDSPLIRPFFTLALGIHLAYFMSFIITHGRLQVASLSEALSSFVLLTALCYWLLELRLREMSMGTFILPILLVLLALSNILYAQPENISPILNDWMFEIHVSCMLISYGAFTLAFIASLLQYLLSRELKKLSMGVFYTRLPSIPFFERINPAAVDIGVVFGVVGFGLGLYGASIVWKNLMLNDPKFYSALIGILIFAFHSIARRFLGWRGERVALIAMFGYGWILFSFILISILFSTQHHFV